MRRHNLARAKRQAATEQLEDLLGSILAFGRTNDSGHLIAASDKYYEFEAAVMTRGWPSTNFEQALQRAVDRSRT